MKYYLLQANTTEVIVAKNSQEYKHFTVSVISRKLCIFLHSKIIDDVLKVNTLWILDAQHQPRCSTLRDRSVFLDS